MQETSPWPTELRVTDEGRLLRISFDDGSSHELSAEYLRVESPSAEVQGHGPGQRVTQYGKRDVTIKQIQPTGNYAVRIQFSDGHSTGIFSFAFLHELGRDYPRKWAAYEAELASKGLSRERK
jgi:DUF971 family protein